MKKVLIAIILVMSLLLCFIACNKDTGDGDESDTSDTDTVDVESSETESESESESESDKPEDTQPPVDTTALAVEKMNTLVKNRPANVALKITTTTGDLSLTADYTVSDTAVTYKVEQYSVFPDIYGDVDFGSISESYKTTLEGSAVIANGAVTQIDGENVQIPTYDALTGNFTFAVANLSNVQDAGGVFSADVKTAADFLGESAANVTNVKVSATYTSAAISTMTITYKTAASSVTLAYTFG